MGGNKKLDPLMKERS